MRKLIAACLLAFSSGAFAGLGNDMQKHFNKWNIPANVTGGGAYHGQISHYYTPGGMFVSQEDKHFKLWNAQKPSASFGDCGEIDIYWGGLSLIDSDQLVDMFKTIAANAQGYLFSLALSQITPHIMSKLQELYALGNEFNYNNISSCRAAKQIVDSGMGILQESINSSCTFNRAVKSKDKTFGKAKNSCQDPKVAADENKEMKASNKTKDSVIANTNITWDAIQSNPVLSGLDLETKYLLMSMVGTIILTTENLEKEQSDTSAETHQPRYVKRTIPINDNYIKHLNHHGKASVLQCQDGTNKGQCLVVRPEMITIEQDKTFFGQVKTKLASIERKVAKGPLVEPDEKELKELKGFLDVSIIPVYKILAVESAFARGNSSVINISSYTDLIATEILLKFLNQGISEVMQSLDNNLLPKTYQDNMHKMATEARDQVEKIQMANMEKIRTVTSIVTRVNMLEKQLVASMSHNLADNVSWGADKT